MVNILLNIKLINKMIFFPLNAVTLGVYSPSGAKYF